MVGLSYELQAFFADNAATRDASTEIAIQIGGSQGHISITQEMSEIQSTYTFAIDDASLLGFGSLPDDRLGEIMVVSASMCCERVYLSPILLRRSLPELTGRRGVSGGISMYGTLTNVLKSGRVETINESRCLDLAGRLRNLDSLTGFPEANLRQGFLSYYWAALSIDPLTRYGHVWAALEKSVNIHADSSGARLDQKAATLAGDSPQAIESIREVNNRLKHALRKVSDIHLLDQLRPTVQSHSLDLKRLTDTILEKRLKELT